jgi:hypothetical protein
MDLTFGHAIIAVSVSVFFLIIRWPRMKPFLQGLSVGLIIAMSIAIFTMAWVDSLPLCRVIADAPAYVASEESTQCINPSVETPQESHTNATEKRV